MALKQSKRISELTALESASLQTTLVGVDNGTTYKVTLDVLEDAIISMVSRSTDLRLDAIEEYTSSYIPPIPNGTISSSAQISAFGFISSSHTDITSLNAFTASQSILNTAFTNGIGARLQTSSFNDFSASVHSEIVAATNEQDLTYLATTGSNTFNGDETISGSLFVSGTTELGGNIVPKTAKGATLGTSERPFSEIFVSSGSINIASDTPGDPDTTLTNIDGNILISTGGMRLIGNASFIAATGSFGYLSGSLTHIGNTNREGNTSLTGSWGLSGSMNIMGNETISGSLYVSDTVEITSALTASTLKVDGLHYPISDGGAESFIQTDGAGNLSLQYVKTLYQNIRNKESVTIQKGTPLFVSGSTGDNSNVYIADAGNPLRMPATLIAGDATLAPNAVGKGIILGHIDGVDTNMYPAGTEVYVGVGGGWSATRPTGSTTPVQPLGIVTRQGNNGMGIVLTVPPTNLPNLQNGYMWVGNDNNQPVTISTGSLVPSLPNDLISSSAQITAFGFVSQSTNIADFTFTSGKIENSDILIEATSQDIVLKADGAVYIGSSNVGNGIVTDGYLSGIIGDTNVVNNSTGNTLTDNLNRITSSFNSYTASVSTGSLVISITNLNSATSSYETNGRNIVSGSSQLTSSFDSRYVLESETGSLQTSITNLNSFTQSFSTSVDSRFDTLEATIISGSPNYIQVLGNRRTSITTTGVSIISGSITTTGNPVQIMVTGDANPIVDGWTRLQIFRGETGIGNIIQVENSSNQNVPYCLNVIDTPSAGTYSYSMRTVSGIAGTFDFGESTGPLLTAVELKTNTNLPSTNNTFTGTNTFNGGVRFGTNGGDEGGEISFGLAQTNQILTGSVIVDVYRNQLRFLESGGSARGVHIDLGKAPNGASGELVWKTSGFVDAGTFVSLDNIKCTVTTSGNRGLSLGAVSTSYTANISGQYTVSGGTGGGTANNGTYTTTASTSLYNWHFPTEGDGSQYQIVDKTNNRVYRVSLMIGASYLNNFISIERLF